MKRTIKEVTEEKVVKKVEEVTLSKDDFLDVAASAIVKFAIETEMPKKLFDTYLHASGPFVAFMAHELFDVNEDDNDKED